MMRLPETVFSIVSGRLDQLLQHAVHGWSTEFIQHEQRGVVIALQLNLTVILRCTCTQMRGHTDHLPVTDTLEHAGQAVTHRDVVLVLPRLLLPSLAETIVVEALLLLAAVVDVLDDVGGGGGEIFNVAGGVQVDPSDAGGDVHRPPVMVIFLTSRTRR